MSSCILRLILQLQPLVDGVVLPVVALADVSQRCCCRWGGQRWSPCLEGHEVLCIAESYPGRLIYLFRESDFLKLLH